MFEHSIKGISLSWNSASLDQLWQTVCRGHIVSVEWNSLNVQKNKLFQSFYEFLWEFIQFSSNAVIAQNIFGNCLLSLFTLWRRKPVPLLHTHETSFPKKAESSLCTIAILHPSHFIIWIRSKLLLALSNKKIFLQRMKTVITDIVPQALRTISNRNANSRTAGVSVVSQKAPPIGWWKDQCVCLGMGFIFSFHLAEYLLNEILRNKCVSVSPNCKKVPKSFHCHHECHDHGKLSLMTIKSISIDVRFRFYNFIRIFLRQKRPPQKRPFYKERVPSFKRLIP